MLPELRRHIPPLPEEVARISTLFCGVQANRCRAREGAVCPQITAVDGHQSTPQKRQAMKARSAQGNRAEQGSSRVDMLWSNPLATIARFPPPAPQRNQDALSEPQDRNVKRQGWRLRARDVNRRIAKMQIRVAVLRGITALGIAVTNVVK
jgi:hypothetical protein